MQYDPHERADRSRDGHAGHWSPDHPGSVLLCLWLGEMGLFAVVPARLGVLFLFAGVAPILRSRVVIEDGSVTVRKSAPAIPGISRIPPSEIEGIKLRQEVVEGVSGKKRP